MDFKNDVLMLNRIINRMCITESYNELENMYNVAIERLNHIHDEKLSIMEVKFDE